MDDLKIGLTGYGDFGKEHAAAISAVRGAQLTCVCVGTEETARQVRTLTGLEVFTDYEDFLERGDMDVVDIVSPNHLHAEQLTKAMVRGKDALLEKPIANELGEARKLVEQHRTHPVRVQVGFQSRYDPFWMRFKRSLDSGEIASPAFARLENWRRPFRLVSAGWRADQSKVGHYMVHHAIHRFDLAAWLFGMPHRISGFTDSPLTWNAGRYGNAFTLMEYSGGPKVVIMESSNGSSDYIMGAISGEGAIFGMYSSDGGDSEPAWIEVRDMVGNFNREKLARPKGGALVSEIQDFLDAIRNGRDPAVTLEDGFRAQLLASTAITAIGTNDILGVPGY
ncbi:MAG: Gfo/Idh/MocA family oxidoreductase [Thaumarchaeota archaeon]|nr:Gfo/Idh/MocA family oxidoreductase [Nitrososphaerota archaeon]